MVEVAAWHTGARWPAAPQRTQNVGQKEWFRAPSLGYGWNEGVFALEDPRVRSFFDEETEANRSLRVWSPRQRSN